MIFMGEGEHKVSQPLKLKPFSQEYALLFIWFLVFNIFESIQYNESADYSARAGYF